MDEAQQAISKIYELQSQGLLRNGLYYVVLIDLVGSTKFAAEHGNAAVSERVKFFVSSSFRALNEAEVSNLSLFVKEIGDAVLFVFQHFVDVLRWRASLGKGLALAEKLKMGRISIRTCVHLGEVFLDGVNPLSLAVSQCFKMEKKVKAEEIVLTDIAYLRTVRARVRGIGVQRLDRERERAEGFQDVGHRRPL
jgi:class 3 adenylate cyclase